MFRTSPECKLAVPEGFDSPGHVRWRLVDSLGPSFLVAVMRLRDDEPDVRRTAMIAWDSDLVHLIESPYTAASIYSLNQVVAPHGDDGRQTTIRAISEIWRGVDRDAGDAEVIIFRLSDGSSFCGQEAIAVPDSVRQDALIARVQGSAAVS